MLIGFRALRDLTGSSPNRRRQDARLLFCWRLGGLPPQPWTMLLHRFVVWHVLGLDLTSYIVADSRRSPRRSCCRRIECRCWEHFSCSLSICNHSWCRNHWRCKSIKFELRCRHRHLGSRSLDHFHMAFQHGGHKHSFRNVNGTYTLATLQQRLTNDG